MLTTSRRSLQTSFRWLRGVMTIILVVISFATAMWAEAAPAQSGSTLVAMNVLAADGNLVLNPDFETQGTGGATDAANWTEGTNHGRASDKFHAGGWSLHSTFRGTGTDTRTTVPIAVSPNTTYTYSGYVWRTNSTGGACMDMNDIAGETQLCTSTSGSWQLLSGTWNSGANTNVTLRLITDGSPTGDIWFDDIALTANPTGDPVIGAAGDIACDPNVPEFNGGYGTATECRLFQVSDLLVNTGLTAVLPVGDISNADGSLYVYQQAYDPTWGRVKSISHPVPGNHDYLNNPTASGYFTYFGSIAGDPAKGYYSYDIGAWHIIALNSMCSSVGGCDAGSPEELWLKADLAAHPTMCTLAYWHHPRFSSGEQGSYTYYSAFWNDLYAAGVELVLNGHDHVYERFDAQNPSAVADTKGIQEFIVGTGGKVLNAFATPQPNSLIRHTGTYGVLKLTLHPTSYDWQFVPEAGQTWTDTGSRNCFNASTTPTVTPTNTPTATPTSTPSQFTFRPVSDSYVDASAPNTNYGNLTQIRVDTSPVVNSYLKFTVQGLTSSVASAKLRIYANSSSSAGIKVYGVSNTSWVETGITYSNAPAVGSQIGSLGSFTGGTWITVDITPFITGNGTFSIAIKGANSTAVSMASRESGANAPQLLITTR